MKKRKTVFTAHLFNVSWIFLVAICSVQSMFLALTLWKRYKKYKSLKRLKKKKKILPACPMSLSATHSFSQDGSRSSPALCPLIWSEWESRELQAQSLCLSTATQPSHSTASFGNQRHDEIYTLPFNTPLLCYNGLDWTGLFPQPPVWANPEHSLLQWPIPLNQGDQAQWWGLHGLPISPTPHTPNGIAPTTRTSKYSLSDNLVLLEQKGVNNVMTHRWRCWVDAGWRSHGDLWSMTS